MRAAVYCRHSTARQDARSLEDQQRRCSEFAAARGWTVGPTYQDAEVSGTQLSRPGLDRLRADARKHRFNVVIVDDLSRLSRDLGAGWSLIFTEFDGSGVIVADVMTGMISTDPAAKMTFATLGLVNMMGVEAVRHQTRRGLDSRARGGFATGGPCFGYRSVDEPNPTDPRHVRKVLVIEEAEAEVIREVFTRWNASESYKQIASDLSARGVPAPRTGPEEVEGMGCYDRALRPPEPALPR
jgi:site-specific DNA recombinase